MTHKLTNSHLESIRKGNKKWAAFLMAGPLRVLLDAFENVIHARIEGPDECFFSDIMRTVLKNPPYTRNRSTERTNDPCDDDYDLAIYVGKSTGEFCFAEQFLPLVDNLQTALRTKDYQNIFLAIAQFRSALKPYLHVSHPDEGSPI